MRHLPPDWEGGHFKGSEEERQRILRAAQAAGAEFVDVEAAAEFVADHHPPAHAAAAIVVSRHDFR